MESTQFAANTPAQPHVVYSAQPPQPPPAARAESWGTITKAIIFVNVAVYVVMCVRGVNAMQPTGRDLLVWGADKWAFTTGGQWWRLLTSTFLHFGLLHLAFNMYALYVTGPITERLFGRGFYLMIYLASGIFASLASTWLNHVSVSAGASGAIFGVYGMLVGYAFLQHGSLPRSLHKAIISSALPFIGYNLFFGFTQKGIDNFAHLGGLFSGLLLGAICARPLDLLRRHRQTLPRAIAGLGFTAISMGLIFTYIPKSGLNVAQEHAFFTLQRTFGDADGAFVVKINSILDGARAKTISEKGAARRIQDEVLPPLEALSQKYRQAQLPDTSPSMPLKEAILKYIDLRRQAALAIINALKNPDTDGSDTEDFDKLLEQQAAVIEQATRKAWAE